MLHALLGLSELFLACIPIYFIVGIIDKAFFWVSRYVVARLFVTIENLTDKWKKLNNDSWSRT